MTRKSSAKPVGGFFPDKGFRWTPTRMPGRADVATEKDYEIILLDIKMPNMDGIQFLEQLRDRSSRCTRADHHGLSEYSQRGRRDAVGRLRLCQQAFHVRGDHFGRAARIGRRVGLTSRTTRCGRERRSRDAGDADGGNTRFVLGRILVPHWRWTVRLVSERYYRGCAGRPLPKCGCRGLAKWCIRVCRCRV
jgi:hypothetical protein